MKPHRRFARKGRWGLVLGVVATALAFATVSYADEPVADGDGAVPVAINPLNLGTVCNGVATPDTALIAINRNQAVPDETNNNLRVFNDGATVTVSASESSAALSVSMTDNQIVLPGDWESLALGTKSTDTATVEVTVTSAALGAQTANVTIVANGLRRDGLANINRNSTLKVDWVGMDCDTDAPEITHTIGTPQYVSGPDTYVTSATTLDFDVDEENHGDSGLDSCTVSIDGPGPPPPPGITGGFNCGEGSNPFTLSASAPASLVPTVKDGSYLNSASATDNFDNTGTDSFTVILDNSNPNFGACTGGPFLLGSGGGSQAVSITANDGSGSGVDEDESTLDGTVDTTSIGSQDVKYTAVDNLGNEANRTCTYQVIYDFAGFFPPVANPPDENTVKAGQAIPIKFSLGGDQGLDIFAAGYPKSYPADCDDWSALGAATSTVASGGSGLNYDSTVNPPIGQYVYPWKTEKAWADSCRVLEVKLNDGTSHLAYFHFTR
jgi:hypothetical protein